MGPRAPIRDRALPRLRAGAPSGTLPSLEAVAMDHEPTSFEEFWEFYVREHSVKLNRTLHFVGSTAALACVAGAVLGRKKWLFAAAPVVGYGFAWAGHFLVEKNKPASFSYPLWSFLADWRMWSKIANGTMDAEVERVMAAQANANGAAAVDPTVN